MHIDSKTHRQAIELNPCKRKQFRNSVGDATQSVTRRLGDAGESGEFGEVGEMGNVGEVGEVKGRVEGMAGLGGLVGAG